MRECDGGRTKCRDDSAAAHHAIMGFMTSKDRSTHNLNRDICVQRPSGDRLDDPDSWAESPLDAPSLLGNRKMPFFRRRFRLVTLQVVGFDLGPAQVRASSLRDPIPSFRYIHAS
jgi:hypothetical protein